MKRESGNLILQPGQFRAFFPKHLPPEPPIEYNYELLNLLSEADRALARLDGTTISLPNPDLFIAMYVKKEALLSSQIEGTQASLEGVLEFEADLPPKENINEIKEVINYVNALHHGIERLNELPMSLRLIKEIHEILLKGTRGEHRKSGEFRTSQNWIGPFGASIREAVFIPPPPYEVPNLMGELEKYIYKDDNIPPLIKIALIHAQFETIHPFLDGNGRIGRLLVTFYLFWKNILSSPLLYLSFYLKKYRNEYYEHLMNTRTEGNWEDWIRFFLHGVIETSSEATKTAKEIVELKENLVNKVYSKQIYSIYALRLIDLIFNIPYIGVKDVCNNLNVSAATGNKLIKKFEQIGVLEEKTGKQRNRKYGFKGYIEIIARGTT